MSKREQILDRVYSLGQSVLSGFTVKRNLRHAPDEDDYPLADFNDGGEKSVSVDADRIQQSGWRAEAQPVWTFFVDARDAENGAGVISDAYQSLIDEVIGDDVLRDLLDQDFPIDFRFSTEISRVSPDAAAQVAFRLVYMR